MDSPTPRTSALLAVLVASLGGAACELEPAVFVVQFEDTPDALAISADQNIAWVAEETAVRPYDADTGALLGPGSAFFGLAWSVRDLAASWQDGHGDAVWILLEDGNRVEITPGGVVLEQRGPIPLFEFPADERVHFELETGWDGAHFITTTEFYNGKEGSFLYRQDPVTMAWSRVYLSEYWWPQLSYDAVSHEIGVACRAGEGYTVVRGYHEKSLKPLYELGDSWSWKLNDFSMFGRYFAVTPNTVLYSPQGDLLDEDPHGAKRLDFRVDDHSNLWIWQVGSPPEDAHGEALPVVP